MNPIKIFFFALATIIGFEDAAIVSRKVSVKMNPVNKTFEIIQEDLFSIVILPEDSTRVTDELQRIMDVQKIGGTESANCFTIEKMLLINAGRQMNANITVSYSNPKILVDAEIDLDTLAHGEFSMMDIPEWNIHSSDAVLKEEYWVWSAGKSVTFVMEPFQHIPYKYLRHQHSILPYWEELTVTSP